MSSKTMSETCACMRMPRDACVSGRLPCKSRGAAVTKHTCSCHAKCSPRPVLVRVVCPLVAPRVEYVAVRLPRQKDVRYLICKVSVGVP